MIDATLLWVIVALVVIGALVLAALAWLGAKTILPAPPPKLDPQPLGAPKAKLSAHDINHSNVYSAAGDITYTHNEAPLPIATSPVTLPMRKPFIGRADLLNQIEMRIGSTTAIGVTSLHGLAGVGKSALALEAAYRFADHFPAGRYWLDLRSKDLTNTLRNLLRALGLVNPEQLRGDFNLLCDLMRGELAGKRVLLVLDNAEGIDSTLLRAICLGPPAATIITSRTRIDATDIRVDVLSDQDALALLTAKGIDVTTQLADAQQLCTQLGNLALALDITARRMMISRPAQSCAAAQQELTMGANLIDVLRIPRQQNIDDNVAASFALTYDQLDDELHMTFHVLGLCASTGVSMMAVATFLQVEVIEARDRLRALALLSLAEFGNDRVELHPLLHAYARARAQEDAEQWQTLLIRHAEYFGGAIGGSYQRAVNDNEDYLTSLQITDTELDNVRLAQERVVIPGFPQPQLAVAITDDLILYWRRRYVNLDLLLGWLTTTRKLAEQTQQVSRQANVQQAIGEVQSFRDDKDAALQSYEEALTLFKQVGDKLGQANIYLELGRLQSDAGYFEQAIEYYVEIHDLYSTARGRYFYAHFCLNQSQNAEGIALLQQARTDWMQIGFDYGVQLIDRALSNFEQQ